MKKTYYEYPAPAGEVSQAIHLHDAERKDTGKSGGSTTDEIEDCITFLKLESRVPTREQVSTTWKETSFKNAEKDPKAEHLLPCLDKSKPLEILERPQFCLKRKA